MLLQCWISQGQITSVRMLIDDGLKSYENFKAIMLSRIKMDNIEIRRCMFEVDDEKLSIDDLKAISKHLPTSEEVSFFHSLFRHPTYFRLSELSHLETSVNWRKQISISAK